MQRNVQSREHRTQNPNRTQNIESKNTTAGVHYFYGEDTWAARQAIDELAQRAAARIRWADRDELEQDTSLLAAGTSLFGRVVTVVRDAGAMPIDLQRAIGAAAASPAAFCVLWERGEPDRRGALWRQFQRVGREFAVPNMRTLAAWTSAQAGERGVSLSAQQASRLALQSGGDRWRILQELGVAAAAGSVAFTQQDGSGSEDVFAVLEALAAGRSAAALAGVRALLAAGHGEFYLLTMLAYQFRTLLIIRSGLDAGLPQFAIVRDGKVKSYAVQKNLSPAQRRSAAFWREGLTRVLATDTAIRAGKVEARTGLLMLVGGLVSPAPPIRHTSPKRLA